MKKGSIVVNPESAESYAFDFEADAVVRIGRKSAAEGEHKLVLPVPEVSGQHAEIQFTQRGWTIRDSGSTNGTMLNGERLTPGREYILQSGDKIHIAQVELVINLPEDGSKRPEDLDQAETTRLRIHIVHATILVGDLRGFTSLMEEYAHEPQIVMQAAQQVFQYVRAEIRTNLGQLEKVSGDAVLAYWSGDHSAAGENAYKACQTALQLRSLVRTLARNKDYWPFEKYPLQLDMALATGPVASGTLLYDQSNSALLGDTANVAFRLEELIGADRPGDILMDGTTHDLVHSSFACDQLGDVIVKGRHRPISVWRLVDYQRAR